MESLNQWGILLDSGNSDRSKAPRIHFDLALLVGETHSAVWIQRAHAIVGLRDVLCVEVSWIRPWQVLKYMFPGTQSEAGKKKQATDLWFYLEINMKIPKHQETHVIF